MNEAMVAGYVQMDWQEMKSQIAADAEKARRENEEWSLRIRRAEEADSRLWGIACAIPFCLILLAAKLCH